MDNQEELKVENRSSYADDSKFMKNIANYVTFLAWAR